MNDIREHVDLLVSNAQEAYNKFLKYDQNTIDDIVKNMTIKALANHRELAKMAVEETGMGIYEDKITKNIFASEYVYNSIKKLKTVGIIKDVDEEDYMEVAEPVGVIAGVTPTTNPTSTTIFKSLIAIKTRNPIIFSFHPRAQKCSAEAARIVRDAAIEAGAPENCIQWIESPSVEASQHLMSHPQVNLILATGGPGMVKAAYSTGKPALGVGAGNVPCYIEKTANIKRAVNDLIMSKTFDNGTICASEQAVIIDRDIADDVIQLMKDNGCYFLSDTERLKLEKLVVDECKCSINPSIVGQSAKKIAEMAELTIPENTKIIIATIEGVGPEYPLSREKLSPILACYIVDGYEEGIKRAEEMVEFGGMGHSAVIHSNDDEVINLFSTKVKAGRIIVNSPSSQGAIGNLYNTNMPSLTLGCGTMGKNSTTQNVSAVNLINIKRVVKRRVNMQWFRIPERIYFEAGSLQYLEKLNAKRAFIVSDRMMDKLGFVQKAIYHLRKAGTHIDTFLEVEPDPSIETVLRGTQQMRNFQPDVIIALGGGSPMDAAKGMWLFYEYPETDFEALKLRFMDIRKRTFKFPKLGRKARLVAVPTTSGTGSEVTAFAVITDKQNNVKYPLADYELTPDVAIIDPELVMTVPPSVTADTGLDVLTHAIEAYVSVMASDYTDALALKAIQLVFDYLPRAYKNGNDKIAREKMHNASCMAGMAFTNAFLGVNHSIAHKIGGEFHIPHGRANAIMLPHVIEYNGSKPSKFVPFPKYEHYIAHEKYQEIAKYLGLPHSTPEEGVKSLADAVRKLMNELNMPSTLSQCGVKKEHFDRVLSKLADDAFEDQCTTANPRMPLVSEIEELIKKAF
ncbi:bifunctional acetaldehyde-CoA/alcohol dehydrogenase [Fervidicella metallireducens AeB]|uniref:Aldehyde-alcohol dehydrogenase n=1 Tax=Fervidicella metallireducens AeB TaxID=1403537 RepID=A0A017RVC0_9CLOT|nr:bifunctional acetaldehyde-CoA/alcohol dehydrogenase [Fervidicella metallireducens]EYE87860.1 bifunctional acetaldehyde-CoA/alcohol dehydrogenase [Fervidicella metallireducens AeB]